MPKKIYRTWTDELPLWLLYAGIAAAVALVMIFLAPHIYKFLVRLDWKFFAKERYLYLRWIFQGLIVTLRLSAVSMVLALLLGTLVAVGRLSHLRLMRAICISYTEFFRNTPLLIQLFFWYFGTSTLLDALAGLIGLAAAIPGTVALRGGVLALKELYNKGQSEFISGIIGLTVYTSAFIAETVRAGIQSIHHGQTEAARASGLNAVQSMWYVILPQAFRIIIPPLLSQFLALTKNSAQAMAIGVAEVTYMARQVEANTFKGFEAFTVATGIYMAMSFAMSYVLNRYNKDISIPEMTKRKQRLMMERTAPPKMRLGGLFAVATAIAGGLLVVRSAIMAMDGNWFAAMMLCLLGCAAALVVPITMRRPEWGVGYIKMLLAAGAGILFFEVLRRINDGLAALEDPGRDIVWPLLWMAGYCIAAAFWWRYFNKRAALFLRAER